MGRKFKVEISSDFDYLWRYNITLACEMLDQNGERLDFLSREIRVADIGSQLKSAPKGWRQQQELSLTTVPSDALRIVLYIVAHTLPEERDVEAMKPFEVRLVAKADNESIYHKIHYVDQRGGASISIALP